MLAPLKLVGGLIFQLMVDLQSTCTMLLQVSIVRMIYIQVVTCKPILACNSMGQTLLLPGLLDITEGYLVTQEDTKLAKL